MKRIILLTLLVVAGNMTIWAQVPQAMNYKAIAKDDWGVSLPNKTITLRFTILQGSESGLIVYKETHRTTTNKFGLIDVEIGKGTPIGSSFDVIDWSSGIYYIKIEMDPNGGTNFRLEDPAHQLLSVPYAFYSDNSGNVLAETDPIFTSSTSYNIMSNDVINWNTAFSWGNHSNEGYLKSFTESDPFFLLHPAHGIASDNINNWNVAYGWGDHDGLYRPLSYVPAWSEVIDKPTFAIVATSGSYSDLNNKPNTDGSETKVNAGTNVTIEGTGTEANPYLINSTGGSGNSTLSQVLVNGNSADGKNIKNLANPIDKEDAVTKAYVDALMDRVEKLEGVLDGTIINDVDGNFYKTIKIGEQVWMAENLSTTKFNDGTTLVLASTEREWRELEPSHGSPPPYGVCWYNFNTQNKAIYGGLYNEYAIENSKLCPTGWSLPSEQDWDILIAYIGGTRECGKLIETGTEHWINSDPNRFTNETGFTALPGGIINPYGDFHELGQSAYWWFKGAYMQTYHTIELNEYGYIRKGNLSGGLSVRCIKN